MFPRKRGFASTRKRIEPHDLVAEIRVPENLVHLHFDVVARVPVAMNNDAPSLL